MDRQAIIERIWNTPALYGMPLDHLNKALEAAGFFDLLEAAEVVASRRGKGSKAGRCDYGGLVPDSELWALYDAINKTKGGAE